MRVRSAAVAGLLVCGCADLGALAGTSNGRTRAAAKTETRAAENIHADIGRFFRDYFHAVEAGEPTAILALIDADFVVKWPVGKPIADREQLRAALARIQKTFRQEIEWEVLESRVNGRWAWARVRERATHFPIAGGANRTLEGSHLVILRNDGRRWLLHRDYGSLDKLPQMR